MHYGIGKSSWADLNSLNEDVSVFIVNEVKNKRVLAFQVKSASDDLIMRDSVYYPSQHCANVICNNAACDFSRMLELYPNLLAVLYPLKLYDVAFLALMLYIVSSIFNISVEFGDSLMNEIECKASSVHYSTLTYQCYCKFAECSVL